MTNEVTTGGTDLYAQLACRIRNALGEFDDRDKDLETLIRDLARVRTRDDGLRANYEALMIRLGEVTEKLEAAERDAELWRRTIDNTGDGLRVVVWKKGAPDDMDVLFPSPNLLKNAQYIDQAMRDSAREGGE